MHLELSPVHGRDAAPVGRRPPQTSSFFRRARRPPQPLYLRPVDRAVRQLLLLSEGSQRPGHGRASTRPIGRTTPSTGFPLMNYAALGGMAIFMLMFGVGWGLGGLGRRTRSCTFSSTPSVNSICHMVGYRNFDNKATNLQSIAFLTAGEGLHNNHHQYPTSARFALRRHEIDPAWPFIRLLEACKLAKVRTASAWPKPLRRNKGADPIRGSKNALVPFSFTLRSCPDGFSLSAQPIPRLPLQGRHRRRGGARHPRE